MRGMSQREEIKRSNGKIEIQHILNISTRDGNRIMKFSSAAKCDRLNDLFANAMNTSRVNVIDK